MWVSLTTYVLIICAKVLLFIIGILAAHVVITDAAVFGYSTYFILQMYSERLRIPEAVCVAAGILVFAGIILLAKWRVPFAVIALLGSYMWAWFFLAMFGWDTKDHLIATGIIVVINMYLHRHSRVNPFGTGRDDFSKNDA